MAGAPSPEPPELPPPSPLSDLDLDFILPEILPKLPPKSYLRFKTVCKSFKNFISSPEFTRLNHRQFLPSNNRLLNIPATNRTLYTFDLDSLSSAPYATFRWPKGTVSVLGSCNGLLLISHVHDCVLPLMLLNPSTRTYIDIRSNTVSRDVPLPRKGNLGFGFDHSSNDYKIVVVHDIDATGYRSVTTRFTMVYSVNSKSWRVVDQTNPSDSMERRYGGVLINNHLLHWMFWSPSKRKRRIGCFDVCSEKWMDDVLLPDYYYDTNHKNYLLDVGVLDGYLFSSFENKVDSCYDVWVMKKYGVQKSWMKLLSVDISDYLLLHGGVVPVARRGSSSSQVLLRLRHKDELLWYNKEDNAINEADVPCLWDLQPYVCNASLVSLRGAKVFGAMYEPYEL